MTILSPILVFRMKVLSAPLSILVFMTSRMTAAAWASLEVSEPTKGRYQSPLQQQVSRFTDVTGFTVDLPTGWITHDYADAGPDAK
jgi:hypothetical protein